MMRVLCLCIVVFLNGIAVVHAQVNFETARIIMSSGDTLSGAIDNRDWERNPDQILFRDADGKMSRYTPLEILGFRFSESGEWYESAILMIDKGPLKDADVIRYRAWRGVVMDTVFLRGLVRGRLSLYSHVDEYARRHFFIRKDSLLELGIEKRIVRIRTGQEVSVAESPREGVMTINHYKDQLASLISDCQTQLKDPQKVSYTERAILSLVISYNNCFAGEPMEFRPPAQVKSRLYITGGVHSSKMTLEGSAYGFNNQGTYQDVKPFGALAYEAVLPRNREMWSVYGELMYRSYDMDDIFGASQLKTTFLLRHTFLPHSKVRPFAAAGLAFGYSLTSNSPLITSKPGEQPAQQFRKIELGFPVEIGVQAGRVGLSIRYERADGFSQYPSTPTPFHLWYGALSVRLTK
jgi:hypothetical protein